MAENTAIEWCDHTINFWWGCTKVDASCAGCYAERDSTRYGRHSFGPRLPRRVMPNAWKTARELNQVAGEAGIRFSVFTNSMADLFEDDHPVVDFDGKAPGFARIPAAGKTWGVVKYKTLDEVRSDVWEIIEKTPNLIWLLLTKRPQNILSMVPRHWVADGAPGNVHFGTSAGTQDGLERLIPLLEACKALNTRSFLSAEPVIESIDPTWIAVDADRAGVFNATTGHFWIEEWLDNEGTKRQRRNMEFLRSVDQVILGGESGPKARPMHPDWVRGIRDECKSAGVNFFFKQWGEWAPADREHGIVGSVMPDTGEKFTWIGYDGQTKNPSWHGLKDPIMAIARIGKKAAGRVLDGRTHDELDWPVGELQKIGSRGEVPDAEKVKC